MAVVADPAVVAVAALPVQEPDDPVVFWLKVGHVNDPVLKLPLVGVPKMGVTNVGLVDSTLLPEPVDVVTPVPPEATANVADNPAAVPVVFWLSVGKVQLARLPLVGVPKIGVTSVGLLESTTLPVPVDVVTPVPPEATAKVEERPAAVPVVF